MKKNDLLVAKAVIFGFGVVVLAVAFVLLSPLFELRQSEYVFACISVSLVYLSIFAPILLGSVKGQVASVFVAGAVYYKGMTTFIVLSLAAAGLTLTVMPLVLGIVIQCVALFILLVCVFMSIFAKGHIESVQRDEDIKKSTVIELRNRAGRLQAKASVLDSRNSIRISAEKIAEEMRYLSPSDSKDAQELERRMLVALDTILMDSYFISGDGSADILEDKIRNFDALYRERKTIY